MHGNQPESVISVWWCVFGDLQTNLWPDVNTETGDGDGDERSVECSVRVACSVQCMHVCVKWLREVCAYARGRGTGGRSDTESAWQS